MIEHVLTISCKSVGYNWPFQIIYKRRFFENEVEKVIVNLVDDRNEATDDLTTTYNFDYLVSKDELSDEMKSILNRYATEYKLKETVSYTKTAPAERN